MKRKQVRSLLTASVLALPLVVMAGRVGAGQPADKGGEVEALIKSGVSLREQGKDEAALREFQRAHELSRAPRALAQIALAEQALGRWIDAEAHLEEALTAAG